MPALTIKEAVIDKEIAEALNNNNIDKALRWESYRNNQFVIVELTKNNTAIVIDNRGNIIRLDTGTYILE